MFVLYQLLLFYREPAVLNNSSREACFGKGRKLFMDHVVEGLDQGGTEGYSG